MSALSSYLSELRFNFGRRLPLILQTESAECGLACLAMIAGSNGYRVDMRSLRQRFAISLKGATLKSLMEIAGHLNLSARPLRLELSDLPKLKMY